MKHLLLFFLFSGSLDGFSQLPDTVQRQFDISKFGSPITSSSKGAQTIQVGTVEWRLPIKPDTLRCTLIVYYDRGPAFLHTKPGYVVRGEHEVFLDDKKKIIKAPWEVLTYKLK